MREVCITRQQNVSFQEGQWRTKWDGHFLNKRLLLGNLSRSWFEKNDRYFLLCIDRCECFKLNLIHFVWNGMNIILVTNRQRRQRQTFATISWPWLFWTLKIIKIFPGKIVPACQKEFLEVRHHSPTLIVLPLGVTP